MEVSPSRNDAIKDCIEKSQIPILPFELELARSAMARHVADQRTLSEKMGEAMNQSSETWHDNAPAEAITHESKTLAERAMRTAAILNEGAVFEYETTETDTVTLGSVVGVRYGKSAAIDTLVLTGATRALTPELQHEVALPEDAEIITLASPIGNAIFNKHVGDVAGFTTPNGREINVTIVSIDQLQSLKV